MKIKMKILFVSVLLFCNFVLSNGQHYKKMYSKCYGLTLTGCDSKYSQDSITTDECKEVAKKWNGNAFTFGNIWSDRGECKVVSCATNKKGDLQFDLDSTAQGHDIWFESGKISKRSVLNSDRSGRNRVKRVPRLSGQYVHYSGKSVDVLLDIASVTVTRPIVPSLMKIFIGILFDVLSGGDISSPFQVTTDQIYQIVREEQNKDKIFKMNTAIQDIKRSVTQLLQKTGQSDMTLEDWLEQKDSLAINNRNGEVTEEQWEVFKVDLQTLNTVLENSRSTFVLRNDFHLSLSYYNEFASANLFVLTMLKLVHANNSELHDRYAEEIQTISKLHYNYLMLAIGEATWIAERHRDQRFKDICYKFQPGNLPSDGLSLNKRMGCITDELKMAYHVDTYLQLSNNVGKQDNSLNIVNEDFVALKYADPVWTDGDYWFSCSGPGKTCSFSDCVKSNAPFKTDCLKGKFSCPRSVFQLHVPTKAKGDPLMTCDQVTLLSSDNEKDQRYYVSYPEFKYKCLTSPFCKVSTNTCKSNTRYGYYLYWNTNTNNDCPDQLYNIVVPGKSCGLPLMDRDVIALVTKDKHIITRESWTLKATKFFDPLVNFFGGKDGSMNGRSIKIQEAGKECDYKVSWIMYKKGSSYGSYLYDNMRDKREECEFPLFP